MKRTWLGSHLNSILRDPAPTDGGGGISTFTGDAALDSAVMTKLGLDMGAAPAAPAAAAATPDPKTKPVAAPVAGAAGTETAEQKAEREALETEEARITALVAETGKTKEEIQAEETSAAEAEEARIAELIATTGKTREEILAEEATAGTAPEFTAEQQTWLDEQNAAVQTELTEAKAKIDELQAAVDGADNQPLAIANVHPLFLIDDPTKFAEYVAGLNQFEKWALANWDGIEAVEAANGQPAQPAYTAAQVRARYAQVKEIKENIVPAAREAQAARKQFEGAARRQYPELFDAKRPESKVAANLLKIAPGLKAVIPNIYTVIGDALRGEKIRVAAENAAAAKRPAAGARPVIKPGGRAPAPRVSPAPTTRTITTPAKKAGDVNVQKIMEQGADRAAIVAAFS